MTKILLLGPKGQLGTDIRKEFEARNLQDSLYCMDRKSIDVSNINSLAETLHALDFDVLLNCTGFNRTNDMELDPAPGFLVNAHAVRIMAEACFKKSSRFITFSTDYVFDGNKGSPYTESDAPGPINVYGASKFMGEKWVEWIKGDNLVLRVASLFGVAGSSGKGGNFIETMIDLARKQTRVEVINDVIMSPTSTSFVASVVAEMIVRKAPPGLYHVVNEGRASWFEFAREFLSQVVPHAEVVPLSYEAFRAQSKIHQLLRPPMSVLACSKLKDFYGPIQHWKNALEIYLKQKGHL